MLISMIRLTMWYIAACLWDHTPFILIPYITISKSYVMRKITDLGPLCTEKHHYEEAQKYIQFLS